MTLKTLDEANGEGWKRHEANVALGKPHPNGIACPKCGAELLDSAPMIMLTSIPPQKNTQCPKCGYRGYRVAG